MALELKSWFYVNINVTDMNRSIAFYEKLGFRVSLDKEVDDPVPARGLGLPAFRVRAAFMQLPHASPHAPLLDLLQYRDPLPDGVPYPNQNHLGICRVAFVVDDLPVACGALDREGIDYRVESSVAFAGDDDWSHGRPTGFAVLHDPDGTVIQLVARTEPTG